MKRSFGSAIQKIRRILTPTFQKLRSPGPNKQWRRSPLQLHDAVLSGAIFEKEPKILFEKFSTQTKEDRKAHFHGNYPAFFNTNEGTLELLGLLIKELRPLVILETGVANGVSTRKILDSLAHFGIPDAQLFSCDVDANVATQDLLDNKQFNFRLIRSKEDFSVLVNGLNSLDLFYHDSDHSYEHQMFEYSEVWKKLRPGGLLVSDDINWSNAFVDFCKQVSRTPYVLSDINKFSGFVQK